jgi:murein DD-endopeptidase MepM/ murein hydrolase activator NlpD
MNSTDKIKKAEKKMFVSVVNTFTLAKRVVIDFFKFIASVCNQKVTVMLIPHSEKRVFNTRVNLFILFMVVFVTFGLMVSITLLSVDNYVKSVRYQDASIKSQANEKRSREYEQILNDVVNEHTMFKVKLNNLLVRLDSPTIKAMQENFLYQQNQGGPDNRLDYYQIDDFDLEKMEVQKLLQDYQYADQAFNEINKMVDSYNKILKDMPYGSPVKGFYTITSSFGFRIHPIHKVLDMHQGIDLAYQPSTPIVSTAPGIVEKVKWDPTGYGWYLRISHKLGYSTLYAHLRSRPLVSPGDSVRKGQIIGYMGRTGATTGTHLHYEIRLGNNLLDPWHYVASY